MGMFQQSRCPFLAATRLLHRLFLQFPILSARFRLCSSSDVPIALEDWTMTHRFLFLFLFFSSLGFGATSRVAKACLVTRTFLKVLRSDLGSVILGTVAKPSRVAETSWDVELTTSSFLLLPKRLKYSGNLGFCSFFQRAL